MVEIKTFIKINESFILIDNFKNKIKDADYIEGAIELNIYGNKIINLEMWDLIDQLWAYLINGLVIVYKENKKLFSTFFPDQPIKIQYKYMNESLLLIQVFLNDKVNSIQVEKKEFLKEIIEKGKLFFEKLISIVPQNKKNYNVYLNHLIELEEYIRK